MIFSANLLENSPFSSNDRGWGVSFRVLLFVSTFMTIFVCS